MSRDARLLASLQRQLFTRCGGVHEASEACGLSVPHLYRCQDPKSEDNLTLARLLVLERHCGEPVVSRGLADACCPGEAESIELMDAATTATLATANVLRVVHDATADKDVTPRERDQIRSAAMEAGDRLRSVIDAAEREAG